MTTSSDAILVTGATGFLGEALSLHLKAAGHRVHTFVIEESPRLRAAGIPQHFVDWNASSLAPRLRELGITRIVHMAGIFRKEHRSEEIGALVSANLTVGIELLEAAKLAGVERFVAAGTSWEQFSADAPHPVNLYAMLKRALRDAMKYYSDAYGLCTVSLKIFDTYGPGDPRNKFLNLLIRHAQSAEPLEASPGAQEMDLLHVEDVCRAFSHATLSPQFQTGEFQEYCLHTGRRTGLKELARTVAEVSGRALTVRWGVRSYSPREVMVPHPAWAKLPGWEPQIALPDGVRTILSQQGG